jgi:hypothetical protein
MPLHEDWVKREAQRGKVMKRVLICLAIAGCAIAPAWAQEVDSTRVVRPYWWDQPVVEGLGRAMVEVEPNRANFTVAFVDTDGSSSKAMEISVARAKLAHEAVKKVAGDKARVKTSVNVVPYYEQYRDRDGNLQTNTREDKVKGYEATATLTVVLYDIALAGRARAAALALGPQDSGQMNIYLEQTIEMQREAIKVAAADARARAEAAAIAAGGTLGDLIVLQEGSGPCMGSWSTRQMARQVGAPVRGAVQDVPVSAITSEDRVVVTGAMIGGKRVEITEADIKRLDLPSDNDKQTIPSSVCAVYQLKK